MDETATQSLTQGRYLMVLRNLSRRQSDSSYGTLIPPRRVTMPALFLIIPLLALAIFGCRSWPGGTYRSTTSDRVIEFKSGIAYITEGHSSQAIPYESDGDKIVLKLPFMNEVLRRMPDGALSGMGGTLVKIDDVTAILIGTYESSEGEYRLRLGAEGRAVYTRLGRSIDLSYTVDGNQITLNQGSIRIPVKRHPDGSLETPEAVMKKQS
jgi:hypothetical protein